MISCTLFSQPKVQDAALWNAIYVEKQFDNGFIPHIKIENRMDQNFLHHDLIYADMGLSRKFRNNVVVTLDYVYTEKHKKDRYQVRHQYYLAAYKKFSYNYWSFTYRVIIQGQMQDVLSSDAGRFPTYVNRHKFTLQRKLSRQYNVFVADELFYNIFQPGNNYLYRNRDFIGLEWNINKHTQIDFYFCLQQAYNQPGSLNRDFIYGINYNYTFK